ncbi:GMC oxidoreductase [Halopseudomonas bauzanensis]|uniref:GMC oxidoreductase n=1 Tax=Halopseudomonas bauzanensis TaxID=653930 RepID=UPI00255640F2|nr:GMC family oxidoreductase [Halopseudomonas bauzanensis]
MQTDFDAIVIGSGITGGWAAKELTEKGLKVLILERGKEIEHGKDYKGVFRPPWEIPFRGKPLRDLYEREYPVQSQIYAFDETTRHFFNNDLENPYHHNTEKPFTWIRGSSLGGKSLMWGRHVYRFSDLDFEANLKDGHGCDWPIRYTDIESWYSYVERHIGVSGQPEGLAHLPDSEFMPPMEMNHIEKIFAAKVKDSYAGERCVTIGRVAVQTEERNGRGACTYCYKCERGCVFKAYFNSLVSTLPAAQATGNLTVRCDSVVESIAYDEEKKRASAVQVIDAQTKERLSFTSKIIFLCGSTVGSTQILLNSKSEAFPNGLGNSSGALGHYLMDHTYGNGAMGVFPGHEDRYPYGYRPNQIYIPRFKNLTDAQESFVRGYGYQGAAGRMGWSGKYKHVPGFGTEFKQAMRSPGPWVMYLAGFGEVLPDYQNRMYLHPTKKDSYGVPQVCFEYTYGENEELMVKDIVGEAKSMLTAAGAVMVQGFSGSPPGSSVHEIGTARMGRNPEDSVLNGWNQMHDVSNLFVTDGSCMASGACVNPSLTLMALTARAANYAAEQMKQGAFG